MLLLLSCDREYKIGEFSMIKTQNLRLIPVKINGKKAKLIIDSGANSTILDKDFADKLEITDHYSTLDIVGVGGSSTTNYTLRYDLEILGDTIKHISLTTNLGALKNRMLESGVSVQGVLGADFLIKKGCVIDYVNNKLTCNKI